MISLVLVSHSAKLAEGIAELTSQMAPDVAVVPAGGTADGSLGTSLEVVQAAVLKALADADGVVVLADLGSAVLTAEAALELSDNFGDRAHLVGAPFVEGAVAAAAAAQQGGDFQAVSLAAEDAVQTASLAFSWKAAAPEVPIDDHFIPLRGPGFVTAPARVRNPLGLHARPAALVARKVAEFGMPMTIGGADGTSVLQLIALGALGGDQLEVQAEGPDAYEAVSAVVALIESGFGEA
ncbi:MAG: dihydroxyacetone kinase phosphoryl donor subunit DhaM [Promicromonosporaceae bacterium]|nr:dihydroxyacetone kinase phosphoryl donor subunit DhaM [Promicromonosporaceae bacterium]